MSKGGRLVQEGTLWPRTLACTRVLWGLQDVPRLLTETWAAEPRGWAEAALRDGVPPSPHLGPALGRGC